MRETNPFDTCSEQYSKFRPDYPPELIEAIYSPCEGLLIDVGAGTGKASKPFASRGVPVISVEPSLPMIREGVRSYPDLRYVCAVAEQLPIASASASVVVCAQAFHWLDAPRALREFARVLKRGGHVGIFWNTRDLSFATARLFEQFIQKWNPGHVLGYRRDWDDRISETGLFTSVEHRTYKQVIPMTIDDWIGLSRSVSYIQSTGSEKISGFERDLLEGLARLDSLDCSYIIDLWLAKKPT